MIAREIGNGRPLVLIHGFEVDHRIMLPLEGALGDLPWRRIYLDLPWTENASPGTAASTQEVADGVVDELRDRLGEEPFALIGNSFGGMIARYVAHTLKDQVLGLATLVPVFTALHEDRTLPSRQVIHREPGLEAADFQDLAVLQTAEAFAAFCAYVLPGLQSADQQRIEKIAASYALDAEPETAHPEPFEAPSLHIFGRQDHITGYEDGWALREHYPRGTFTVLDAAGHNLHLERPELVSALIRDWIARMGANPGSGAPGPGC